MKSGSSNENRGSVLLKPEENEQIFSMIGNRCQCLAAGVIQLYLTESPSHREWIKKHSGVIALIRDSTRRSYFLRLYCLQRLAMIWEHEVYNSMDYKTPTSFFHTFEGEECMVGFNFASDTDAMILRNILLEKLNAKKSRKNSEKRKAIVESSQGSMTLLRTNQMSPMSMIAGSTGNLSNGSPSSRLNMSGSRSFMDKSKKNRKKKSKETRLTKDQIGLPSDFHHIIHVGFNPDRGFELDSVDPSLKKIFEQAGVSEKQIRNKETREFIYGFIDDYRKVMKESGNSVNDRVPSIDVAAAPPQPPIVSPRQNPEAPPPIPIRTIPVNANNNSSSPSAASSNNYQTRIAPRLPPMHNQQTSTGPPVYRTLPARPPPPSNPPVSNLSPAPPPAPPPLPPVVSSSAPPPPPPPLPVMIHDESNNENDGQQDTRSRLMDQIKSGTSLRKVTKEDLRPNPVSDSRSDLLNQIRQGIELKPVANETRTSPSVGANLDEGLAGALHRALMKRNQELQSSESEGSTSDTSNDSEWND